VQFDAVYLCLNGSITLVLIAKSLTAVTIWHSTWNSYRKQVVMLGLWIQLKDCSRWMCVVHWWAPHCLAAAVLDLWEHASFTMDQPLMLV